MPQGKFLTGDGESYTKGAIRRNWDQVDNAFLSGVVFRSQYSILHATTSIVQWFFFWMSLQYLFNRIFCSKWFKVSTRDLKPMLLILLDNSTRETLYVNFQYVRHWGEEDPDQPQLSAS